MNKSSKKKRGKAESGSTAIHFRKEDRLRISWLERDLGVPTLAGVVKWAVKDAYDRRRALHKVGRMSQGLRATLPPVTVNSADVFQYDIRHNVQNHSAQFQGEQSAEHKEGGK